jgi:UDP-N-acetylglucosamine 4-epimerase
MKAVIPKWIAAMIRDEMVSVNGDGETSRDFCYIENVTQANVLAATTSRPDAVNQVYNVGLNVSATLNQLLVLLWGSLKRHYPHLQRFKPTYWLFSAGRRPRVASQHWEGGTLLRIRAHL